MNKLKVVIIGSGNVASHLAKAILNTGHEITQIFSRTAVNAKALADISQCPYTDQHLQINKEADLYLICVSDSSIEKVVEQLSFNPKLIVHTAGSVSLSVLRKYKNHGVFYPLQTFSKQRDLNIRSIPFCIEANNEQSKKQLYDLASKLSDKVIELDSEQRKQCHLAAIFANNFVNHCYTIAAELLENKNIPFDLLHPLIKETASKIEELHPTSAQTGPAIRNDSNVMDEHKRLLSDYDLEELYSFVSDSIIKRK